MTKQSRTLLCGAFLALFVLQLGCSGSPDPRSRIVELNSSNIIRMRSCYQIYRLMNGGPPKDEKSFREYFENDTAAAGRLKRIGVDVAKFADILVSERDGEPFVVRWGVGGGGDEALIFEAKGVDGKRMVAFNEPREVDSDEYDALLNQKVSK